MSRFSRDATVAVLNAQGKLAAASLSLATVTSGKAAAMGDWIVARVFSFSGSGVTP
jgi:hypothetical protein